MIKILAVVAEDVQGIIQYGIRRSKNDLRVSLVKGDVVLLVTNDKMKIPQVIVIPGKASSLDYHPGNVIVSKYNVAQTDTVLYQNRVFCIKTNEELMIENARGMMKGGSDPINFVELMERIVIARAKRGVYTGEDEKNWEKYLKLRARFMHPTTPAPEAASAKKLGAAVLTRVCFPTNNGNGGS